FCGGLCTVFFSACLSPPPPPPPPSFPRRGGGRGPPRGGAWGGGGPPPAAGGVASGRGWAIARRYAALAAPSRSCGRPAVGFARYRVRDDWSGGIATNTVEVIDLYALHDDVEAALWQFVVDIDLVASVKAFGRPVDDPIRWRLADPRRLQIFQITDHLWVRV